jgi:hypothetical protein
MLKKFIRKIIMKSVKYIVLAILSLIIIKTAIAQEGESNKDTAVSHAQIKPYNEDSGSLIKNSWGMDLIFSTNGFGLGVFYGYEFSDALTWKINFSASEAKDAGEVEQYNPYTGESFVPLKVNRFIAMPLLFAVEYQMFKDEIMDNFRPYITAAIGPTMIFATPYEKEFFNSLKYGRAYYTGGGYLGIGAFFGSERSRIMGVNIRYYIIPYAGGIESLYNVTKKEFGGFSISLSFGSGW